MFGEFPSSYCETGNFVRTTSKNTNIKFFIFMKNRVKTCFCVQCLVLWKFTKMLSIYSPLAKFSILYHFWFCLFVSSCSFPVARSYYVAQADHELLGSRGPPITASRVTGLNHFPWKWIPGHSNRICSLIWKVHLKHSYSNCLSDLYPSY